MAVRVELKILLDALAKHSLHTNGGGENLVPRANANHAYELRTSS
jgi:hypothetical protein